MPLERVQERVLVFVRPSSSQFAAATETHIPMLAKPNLQERILPQSQRVFHLQLVQTTPTAPWLHSVLKPPSPAQTLAFVTQGLTSVPPKMLLSVDVMERLIRRSVQQTPKESALTLLDLVLLP